MKLKPVMVVVLVLLLAAILVGILSGGFGRLFDRNDGKIPVDALVLPLSKEKQAAALYEKARRLMNAQHYREAKKPCLELLNRYSNVRLSRDGHTYRVGPAALEMLAENYVQSQNSTAALECYRKMVKLYRNDLFNGYRDGEAYWYGKAGAAGLIGQITVLIDMEHDYNQAKKLAYQLIDEYRGEQPVLWEWTMNYEEFGADFIRQCLEANHASPEETEAEYRTVIAKASNDALAADLLLALADKAKEKNLTDKAETLYREVIQNYGVLYRGNEVEAFRFYGLEAYRGLIELSNEPDADPEKLASAKAGMRNLYGKIVTMVKASNAYDSARETLAGFEESFK